MILLILLVLIFIYLLWGRKREKYANSPSRVLDQSGLYDVGQFKTITVFGGGGGGAAVNVNTGSVYAGGGGGQGYAGVAPINPLAKYIYVTIGKGGTSDIDGQPTIVQALDINKKPIQTVIGAGGKAGGQGYLSMWDVPNAGDGGDGFCGGGGGGIGNFPIHENSKVSQGGQGVLPQYNGAPGTLLSTGAPSGGQGGCNGGKGGTAWLKYGGGGGGGGFGGGEGGDDGTTGSPGGNATGLSAGGGGATFGTSITDPILAGGKGGDGYVILN